MVGCSLTPALHGVTFLAFGNGAPDVFSAVVAFSDPRTAGLAVGAVFGERCAGQRGEGRGTLLMGCVALAGAGIFVTTVVAGGIALVKPFAAASRPFLRDVIFYMVAVFLTFLILYFGHITLGEALGEHRGRTGAGGAAQGSCNLSGPTAGYLGLYVFYVFTVVLCTWIHRWQRGDGPSQPGPWEPGKERSAVPGGIPRHPPLSPCSLTAIPTDAEEQESSGTNCGDYGRVGCEAVSSGGLGAGSLAEHSPVAPHR